MSHQCQHLFVSSGSIDIDEFEDTAPDEFADRTDTERIVLFLDDHDDRAWKAATIAERLGLETDAVSAILSRLKDRGLVRHKRPYWAITDDAERLHAAYRLHRHHETADDHDGEEHLEDRGLVRHKGNYWALGEADEGASSTRTLESTRTANDRFGEEDMEEWLAHAVDDEATE